MEKKILDVLKKQYENCLRHERELINEKKRRFCLAKLANLERSKQFYVNQCAYVRKLENDIAHYDILIRSYTKLADQFNNLCSQSVKLQSLLLGLLKENRIKAFTLEQEISQDIDISRSEIDKITLMPQPLVIANINEIAEAFFHTNENEIEIKVLKHLISVLHYLSGVLKIQETTYHENGYAMQQLRELYDARMLLSAVKFKTAKQLKIKKTK